MVPYERRYVVSSVPGPGTATGEGDILIDNRGNRYRVVSDQEADMIRNSTGGWVATLRPDGSIG